MKKLRKILLVGSVVSLLLILGVLAYLRFGNLAVHKDRILTAASEATGFDISVAGPFSLSIGGEVRLAASDAKITNPSWPDGPELAAFGELKIVVDTWSLFSGPLEIDLIELDASTIALQESAGGETNWKPTKSASDTVPPNSDEPAPIFHRLIIRDFRLVQKRGDESLIRNEVAELHLTRTGKNSYEYQLESMLGKESPEVSISASGNLQIDDQFASLADIRLEFDDAALSFSGPVSAAISFAGAVDADLSGERPRITTSISAPSLEIIASESEDPVAADPDATDAGENGGYMFSDSQLDLSGLDALDLDAEIRIESGLILGNQLQDLHLATSLSDGDLNVAAFDFAIDNGDLSASLSVTPTDGQIDLQLAVNATSLRFVQLKDPEQALSTVPPLDAELRLSGRGASLHDIMASSSGRLSGRLGNGQIDTRAMNAFFSDFLTSIVRTLNPATEEQSLTDLECGVFEIEVESGAAEIQEMAVQTDRLTMVGSGTVRFDTEQINISMQTKLREGLGLSLGSVASSFVKLGGTLQQPALGVDAAGSVTSAGAAVATGGLSVLAKGLWDRVSSAADLCSRESQP